MSHSRIVAGQGIIGNIPVAARRMVSYVFRLRNQLPRRAQPPHDLPGPVPLHQYDDMTDKPIATLDHDDPLFRLLSSDVWPRQLGLAAPPDFEVSKLHPSGIAYRYADPDSGTAVVGKFFGNKWVHGSQEGNQPLRAMLLQREFANLQLVQALGFDQGAYQVVRPLVMEPAINLVLIESAAPGTDLLAAIRAAAFQGAGARLRRFLTAVAGWLAALHRRSAINRAVEPVEATSYFNKLLGQLRTWDIMDWAELARFERLRDRWVASGMLGVAQQALVHGDATPAHFLYDGTTVTVIDLERLRAADPAADLGSIAAELRHMLSWYKGDTWAGEPYIRHFYAQYAAHMNLSGPEFDALTERCRFYMGTTELRICRNSWVDLSYRRAFLAEAERCLAL